MENLLHCRGTCVSGSYLSKCLQKYYLVCLLTNMFQIKWLHLCGKWVFSNVLLPTRPWRSLLISRRMPTIFLTAHIALCILLGGGFLRSPSINSVKLTEGSLEEISLTCLKHSWNVSKNKDEESTKWFVKSFLFLAGGDGQDLTTRCIFLHNIYVNGSLPFEEKGDWKLMVRVFYVVNRFFSLAQEGNRGFSREWSRRNLVPSGSPVLAIT